MKDENPGIIAEANVIAHDALYAQREHEARNASRRQAERQAKMDVWQDPEAMIYRKALHEKGAIESLWSLRQAGECASDRDIPIPPDSELPPEMRGQQPSTVRAFLRGSKAWNKKIDEQLKADMEKAKIRGEYPELFGIDFTKVMPVTFGDEHKVRNGKTVSIKGEPYEKATLVRAEPKKGAMARFFAGIKGAFEEL